ncbi:MAG: dihydrodipicolinate synthase family protein [Gemmatimonadales bacterium]
MLNGILLPVTTPFQRPNFDLDAEAFAANLRKWATHPIAGVVVGGSTGEAPLLELQELARLVDLGRSVLPESVLLVAGSGRESTRGTVSACRLVAERGAEAVLVRPPSYFRAQMTPEALREHFLEVAERSPVPVILYHVPKFVPVDLVPDLVGRLVEHPNIVAIKDSSGDLKNLGALTEACADRASVLVGSGSHLYAGLELGVTGGILAVALIAPGESCAVMEAWRAGRAAEAGRAQETLGPLNRAVVGGTGVPGIKHALDLLGYRGGDPRPPLLPPTGEVREKVRAALARAALLPDDAPAEPGATTVAGGERV